MNKTITIIIVIISLLAGCYIGWHAKPTKLVDRHILVTDTITQYDTIKSKPITSNPKNIVTKNYINLHDTEYVYVGEPDYTFTLDDTLSYEGLSVAIHDEGGCSGIMDRHHEFIGAMPTKIVTNTIEQRVNMFQLNAGVATTFGNRKLFDVLPTLSVSYKQKYLLGYQYGLNNNTHNLSLQTKIK